MLIPLSALNDNYIWLYSLDNKGVIVIDPGQSKQVIEYLERHNLTLELILLTHGHEDHVGGVRELTSHFPNVPIYGPEEVQDKGATHLVNEGVFAVKNYTIQVIPTAGHTKTHVSYLLDDYLLCGDLLFSAGCGRVFTGDCPQMFDSIQKIKKLPDNTLLCAGHEFTLANLAFAKVAMADNSLVIEQIEKHSKRVNQLRLENKPSLPSTLALEKKINPFIITNNLGQFTELRQAKDNF